MELKKHPQADLTRKAGLFLNIGLVVSLTFCIAAFEWKFYNDSGSVNLGQVNDDFEELAEIPPTQQPPPPPPKIQQPQIIEVPDEEEIEEEIEIDLDVEITEETVIEEVEFEDPGEEEETDEIFTIVEQQPEPVGGISAFYNYVSKRIKYPSQARRMAIEGRVFVQFVVERDGTIQDVQVMKGIGGGCDEEAIRVVKSHPKWKPGKQRGKPVRVRITLPIAFRLGN